MLRYFTPYKFLCGVILFSIFFEVAYAVAAPLSLKYLVDDAFTPKDFQAFIIILSILLVGGSLNICANACGDYSIDKHEGAVPKQSNLLGAALFVERMRNDRLWFI
jgi:ATP-binding cassette subfamily B protein